MNIYSAEQLYQADKITVEKQGISSLELMERASTQIFNWLHQRMQGAQVPIHIFCGIGNNGGDGLALGRILINSGYKVHVYIANFTDKRSKCFLINYGKIKDITKNWPVLMSGEKDFPEIHPDDIIIDALFGIGLNRPIDGWVKQLVQYLNEQKAFKLSIDIPSGLSANEPLLDPEAVVRANHTLTFQTPKLSFFLPETGRFVPYFEALDIGLDQQFLMETQPIARVIIKPQAQTFYKQREKYAHKGDFGHALLITGSKGKIGASVLASGGVLRAGAGLLTVHIPGCGYDIVQTALPEAMVITDVNQDHFTQLKLDFEPSAIGLGMGLGQHEASAKAMKELFESTKTNYLIDADAINLIANHNDLKGALPKLSVLTPHPGELRRLLGEWKNDYEKLEKTRKFSKEHDVIIVIKGANTITVYQDDMFINSTGNPGMATAGSGDVLSGIITGLLAQSYEPLIAAIFGVYLHGSAGNLVAQEIGYEAMIASDLSKNLGKAYLELFKQEPMPEDTAENQEQPKES